MEQSPSNVFQAIPGIEQYFFSLKNNDKSAHGIALNSFFLKHKNSVTYRTITCKQMIGLTYDVDSKPKKVANCEKKY